MSSGPDGAPRSGLAKVVFGVLGIVGLIAWALPGFLIPFAMALTPDQNDDVVVGLLQVLLVGGWLACLGWLLRDLANGRFRFTFAPVAAWLWVFGVLSVLGMNASLEWPGY